MEVDAPFLIPPPHLECHNSSHEQKWESRYPYDSRRAPAGSGVISKGNRVFRHVPEEALKGAGPPFVWPVQAGMERPEEEWQQSSSPWRAPSSGTPWQDSHQTSRIEFPNFVVHVFVLFFFCLSFKSTVCPMQNNTFREEGELSL